MAALQIEDKRHLTMVLVDGRDQPAAEQCPEGHWLLFANRNRCHRLNDIQVVASVLPELFVMVRVLKSMVPLLASMQVLQLGQQ